MLSKKDKYTLRALGNTLKPVVIIGKDGFNENILKAIDEVIEKQELIKISLLKTYVGDDIKTLSTMIASLLHAEFIFSVGRVAILYRKNKDINKYDIK